jgi:hypothetical protein
MECKPSEKNMRALQNIVGDNPWFAIGQQLLLWEIQELDNQNFEKYLHKVAIYTTNREILYKKLYDGSEQNQTEEIQQDVIVETQNITDESQQNIIVETQNITEEPQQNIIIETQNITDETQQNVIAETQNITEESQQNVITETQNITEEPQQNVIAETQNITEEPQQNIIVETQNITEEPQQNVIAETQNLTEEPQQNIIVETQNRTEESQQNIIVETQNQTEESQQNIITEPQNLTEEQQNDVSNESQKSIEKPVYEIPVADYFSSQSIPESESSEDIIDKFLASPQKISAAHKSEDGETAETPTIEPIIDYDFVTETLAKIYAEQGYFTKAIEVYEKLSLQDSKKSIYFAALIENLKRRNKN